MIKTDEIRRYFNGGGGMLAFEFKMAQIADAVFLLLVIVLAFINARKGFIHCFFSFVSTVVAIILVYIFAGRMQEWTGGLFGLEDLLKNGIGNALCKVSPFDMDISPSGIEAQLSAVALPAFIKDAVIQEVQALAPEVAEGTLLGVYVGGSIAELLVLLICSVALFFAVKLVMLILRGIFTKIVERVALFRKINRLGGMLVGVFEAFVIVCAVLAVLSLIPNEGLVAFFDDTLILKGLYHQNPINTLLAGFLTAA